MNPPQKPVRPPKPPPVPKDDIVDANKMVETPRTMLQERLLSLVHAFSDEDRKYAVRLLAQDVAAVERELAAVTASRDRFSEVLGDVVNKCANSMDDAGIPPGEFTDRVLSAVKQLAAANARIRLLISERDTARMQADRNYKLREEFVSLLNTDDIERGVEVVKALKSKVDYLQNWIRRLEVIKANPTEHRRWCGEIGWLYPGQYVFVGPEKPEGLR